MQVNTFPLVTKEEAKEKIRELIEKFESQKEYFKTLEYNETQTRKDFIDPFFRALGWDIDNKKGKLESYRDVKLEDKIRVSGRTKSPDYAFNVNGKRTFFVEAKKPAVPIKEQPEPAIQVRNYAWNASLLISVVTDFEEFAIYDCTRKPRKHDRAITKRLKYIHYTQYLQEFDFLWDTFAFENVEKGSITAYGQKYADLKNAEPVDKAFLKSLEDWRTYLATNIAQLNKNLEEYELNFAVQQTIDRIVFLKVCEDRMLEKEGSLIAQIKKGNYYQNLYQYFVLADQKYNSGLFDLKKDTVTANLHIDNKVIKSIIEELYGEDENGITFNFNIIPVEILGYAYEQFLGKVIYLTSANSAKIEEKPEVRKAGGVYYTPQYIVDYIVKETLGEVIAGKTPQEISAIKVLDPACGSGSFLLGAYQYLLDYHLSYYQAHPSPLGKAKGGTDTLTPDGKLTTAEKKRILLNNIFGVDIDAQAVEVTKLSLLLKALEGETEASIHASLKLFNERVLPSIDDNIQCGNSLIGTDFYNSGLFLTPKEERKINVFDWKIAFKEVFRQGGFDVVMGNPPYRTLQLGKKQESEKEYLLNYYKTKFPYSFSYKVNLFALFMERMVFLLKSKQSYASFIVPSTFHNSFYFKSLRKFLLEKGSFSSIYDIRFKVFNQAEIGGNSIFVYHLDKYNSKIQLKIAENRDEFKIPKITTITTEDILQNEHFNINFFTKDLRFEEKFKRLSFVKLGEIAKIYQGIITGNNQKFLAEKRVSSDWQPILRGRDINRYSISYSNIYVYYKPEELWSNANEKMFRVPEKIISRQTSDKLVATLDTNSYFSLDSTHVIHLKNDIFSLKYLLGIFNSKLLNFIYQSKVNEGGRVFAQVKVVNLKVLPIRLIDFNNPTEKQAHDEIVKFVGMLLELNKRLHKATLPSDIRQLQARIQAAERQIDQLIYQLYELSPEEIKLIDPEYE
ncbi:Eco57I restriction-modification methylase domain-containing protein [Thermoflexibacter ruber]|uniref:site-specific DNA-methyltransferase (adenine-specific) n=1 Tax=Thermoflexibacter ruber TaxID=1003 RepID=A0A1I2EHY3_9BACT|nr:TaqI-like C-terminal specificity domain-containing protein [Thermoflexibacter ruber]SFE92247.1 Type I restriction enzyme R protein N terminus (HSDR_N) [Thermoflexibacter ruber]